MEEISFSEPLQIGSLSGSNLLRIIWTAGAMSLLFAYLYNEVAFRRKLQSIPVENSVYRLLPENFEYVLIRQSDMISSPFTMGIFRPLLVLPITTLSLSDQELRSILAHECSHIKRNDVLHNMIRQFAAIIWLFNPFIWLAVPIVFHLEEGESK